MGAELPDPREPEPERARRRNLLPGLSLRTWLLGSHLLVLLLPMLALIGTGALAMDLRRQTELDLRHQAEVLTLLLGDRVASADAAASGGPERALTQLDPLLAALREQTLASVQIVGPDGRVLAASGAPVDRDLSDDPVVAEALAGREAAATRPRERASERQPLASPSRRARVRLFVAKPIVIVAADGREQIVGAVLLSRTPREELQALYHMSPRLIWGLLAALILTVALAVFAGRLATRSLESLADAAQRITHGSGSEGAKLLRSAGSHVDEVRALATAVASMAEQLESRVAYINEFAGNVAHEFRTPITTLRGTAELLRDAEDDDGPPMDPAQRRRFLANALAELDRLERLVAGLLALARAEQPHAGGRSSLPELLRAAGQRWPEIEVHAADRAGEVEGSAAQLATVLDNLIDNAYAHAGAEVQVKVRGLAEDEPETEGRTGFEVVDDGPGVSPSNRERIFDRFFTTNREQGGTGLGLALCQRIVETHGGTIELDSGPSGTRVRVWLPRA